MAIAQNKKDTNRLVEEVVHAVRQRDSGQEKYGILHVGSQVE